MIVRVVKRSPHMCSNKALQPTVLPSLRCGKTAAELGRLAAWRPLVVILAKSPSLTKLALPKTFGRNALD